MRKYILHIAYLCPSVKKLENLMNRVSEYHEWTMLDDSTWVIMTDQNPVTIRDSIRKWIDLDDCVFVFEITGTFAVETSKKIIDGLNAMFPEDTTSK